MLKFSLELKLEVVEYVLKEQHSIVAAARKYKVDRKSVREWIALYKYHNVEGLQTKRKSYDDNIKSM